MATKKKKTTAKKAKAAAKKPATKKAPAKKTPTKKTATKKTPTKTSATKKAAKKKATKKTTKKTSATKKAAAKKAAAKTPKKTATKKSSASGKSAASSSLRTVVQHVFLPAPPSTIYRMLTDPVEHGAFTGTVCEGEPIETGSFTASSGYISGRYEVLEQDRLIVCSWQTSEWPKGAAPSRLEFVLEPVEGGTELTMTHSELPASQAEDYRQGWIDYYWTPMREALKA
jgi:activator of HSP90 ATPase